MDSPVDVFLGIEADILRHTRSKEVVRAPKLGDGDGLPLEVADGSHPVRPEEFIAANMHTSQEDNWGSCVNLNDERWGECHGDISCTRDQLLVDVPYHSGGVNRDILDVGKPLSMEQLLGNKLRSDTNAGGL